jgi:alpha-glucosidase
MWHRSGGVDPGRDGCRVPLPWSGSETPYGFSPNPGAELWLDQPDDWAALSVEAQLDDPESMLSLYRTGLSLRRQAPWGAQSELAWLEYGQDVIAFRRGERFACIVNFGSDPIELPAAAEVVVASTQLDSSSVPQDTTVWFYQAQTHTPPEAESNTFA